MNAPIIILSSAVIPIISISLASTAFLHEVEDVPPKSTSYRKQLKACLLPFFLSIVG